MLMAVMLAILANEGVGDAGGHVGRVICYMSLFCYPVCVCHPTVCVMQNKL